MSNRRKARPPRPLPFGPTIELLDEDTGETTELRLSFPPHLVTPELRRLVLADPDAALAAYIAAASAEYGEVVPSP